MKADGVQEAEVTNPGKEIETDRITLGDGLWLAVFVTCVLGVCLAAYRDIMNSQSYDPVAECAQLQMRGLEAQTRYDKDYGCVVKRGDHWEKSKW